MPTALPLVVLVKKKPFIYNHELKNLGNLPTTGPGPHVYRHARGAWHTLENGRGSDSGDDTPSSANFYAAGAPVGTGEMAMWFGTVGEAENQSQLLLKVKKVVKKIKRRFDAKNYMEYNGKQVLCFAKLMEVTTYIPDAVH